MPIFLPKYIVHNENALLNYKKEKDEKKMCKEIPENFEFGK